MEYAVFFGSIEIINYMYLNGVSLTQSLWWYSIHGNNPDIIHFLEDNLNKPTEEIYTSLLFESIICHHNNIANYILVNFIHDTNTIRNTIELFGFKNYNYDFFPVEFTKAFHFYNLCKYNYIQIVELLLKNENLPINNGVFDIYN